MNELLKSCVNGETLSEAEANEIMHLMMTGSMSAAEIGGFLSVLAYRGETVDEVTGFVRAMREKALAIDGPGDVVDTCGTGETAFPRSIFRRRPPSSLHRPVPKSPSMATARCPPKAEVQTFSNISGYRSRRRLRKQNGALNVGIWAFYTRRPIILQ